MRVEGEDGVGEVFADVGGEHGAHAEFARGEIAGEAADVECCNRSSDGIGAIFEGGVSLGQEAGDQAR